MKTKLSLAGLAIVVGLLAAGCSKQENGDRTGLPEDGTDRYIALDLSVSGQQFPASRTSLENDHSLSWKLNDSIAVYAEGVSASYRKERDGNPGKYLTKRKELINFALAAHQADGAAAKFQAPEGHADGDYEFFGFHWKVSSSYPENTRNFYAYYPHSEEKPFVNYSGWNKKFPFSLPNEQTQPGKSDFGHLPGLDILYASTTLTLPDGAANNDEMSASLQFDFQHLFALLKYEVTNATSSPLRIDRIALDAGTQPIAGDFQVDAETGNMAVVRPASSIVLNCKDGFTLSAGESVTVYMVAAPAILSGATVRVETDRGQQEFPANATLAAGSYYTKNIAVNVPMQNYTLKTADFEDIVSSGQSKFLADSPFGDNVDGKNTNYAPYTDAATGLVFSLNKGAYQPASYDYHRIGGGFWGSNYNDMTTSGVLNHSSVYYSDPGTGKGGYGGSEYFAVCYESTSGGMSYTNAQIAFETADTEKVFEHLWVNNNTFAVLDMENGSSLMTAPFSYALKSWCKLIVTGVKADGTEVGRVEFYLADFRTADAPGIVKEWSKVNLLPLGKVHSLRFSMESSDTDEFLGTPALNNPAYFCIDNVTVRL